MPANRLEAANRELELNAGWIAAPFRRRKLGTEDFAAIRKRALYYLEERAKLDVTGVDVLVRWKARGVVEFVAVPQAITERETNT